MCFSAAVPQVKMHTRMPGRLWTCWQMACENSSAADQSRRCAVSGHIRTGEVGVLIRRHIRQMPCSPSQFTDTHGNPLTNKEHHSAHIPCHYVKRKKPAALYHHYSCSFWLTHTETLCRTPMPVPRCNALLQNWVLISVEQDMFSSSSKNLVNECVSINMMTSR